MNEPSYFYTPTSYLTTGECFFPSTTGATSVAYFTAPALPIPVLVELQLPLLLMLSLQQWLLELWKMSVVLLLFVQALLLAQLQLLAQLLLSVHLLHSYDTICSFY